MRSTSALSRVARCLPALAMLGMIGGVLWLERRKPLRWRVEPGPRRLARNAAMAAVTAAAITACERPLIRRVTRHTERRRWGLVPRLGLPRRLATALVLVLMDYTLYWWHVLLHRVPALWRLHVPHHADLDLDASTAVRFHFTEFLASIPWRMLQIALLGANRRTLSLWQKLTLAEVIFHHSNARLPFALERWLSAFIVTPRMHGIHHSIVRDERDANFSSGLAVWDVLHGTSRRDVKQAEIIIGLPAYRRHCEVTLGKILALPFRRQRPAHRLPDGREPIRTGDSHG